VLQALPDLASKGAEALEKNSMPTELASFAAVPSSLSHDQARELLKANAHPIRHNRSQRLDLELYVQQRTKELLPKGYAKNSSTVAQSILQQAKLYGMDPLFVMALIQHESRFNPNSQGGHGEIGLMQIKPSTALWIIQETGVLPFSQLQDEDSVRTALKNPSFNIAIGTAYLARLRKDFKRHGLVYLSAYNMGAVNAKSLLRQGDRPRIYSDLVINEYVSLRLAYAANSDLRHTSIRNIASHVRT
jgi:soluble lytic murein transglycosylase